MAGVSTSLPPPNIIALVGREAPLALCVDIIEDFFIVVFVLSRSSTPLGTIKFAHALVLLLIPNDSSS